MSAALPLEDEVARRWWSLSPGCILPLSDGSRYQLLFAGRPGGSCGPDVRDAVLCHVSDVGGRYIPDADRLVGDVEFHVRAGDWLAHRHHTDARYNRVILHVVLRYDDRHTPRQDGQPVPICSLYDLPLSAFTDWRDTSQALWPCQNVMANVTARQCLLRAAGLARFELKSQSFIAQLHTLGEQFPGVQAEPYNLVLIPALAEGLGYGRDRDFFRATGLFLLGLTEQLPQPLGHGWQPEPLDARRLRVLRTMVYEWRDAWKVLRSHLLAEEEHRCLQALRDAFTSLGLGASRSDILVINIVLPFALAVAALEHDERLARRASSLYEQHPGLSSNRITRMMCTQLRLPEMPRGSCQQQGLHHIYQQTCREKRCEICLVGKRVL